MSTTSSCPTCHTDVPYHRITCDRGHFVGFPNVRLAVEMRGALQANYDAAIAASRSSGTMPKLTKLEALLLQSTPVVNVSPRLLSNMAAGLNYISYYRALSTGLREIAERKYHAHRDAVDAKIHTGYAAEVLNAALSPDGRGLANYGPINLEIAEVAVEDRASLIRENAFDFYERNDLGRRNAVEEPGWRCAWSDRVLLGVAHLGPDVTPSTKDEDLSKMILGPGLKREDDRYIEVHIYGELTWQTLSKITLEIPLVEPEDRDFWDFGKTKLLKRGIAVEDASL